MNAQNPLFAPIGFISKDQYDILTLGKPENGECCRIWHANNPPSRANIPVYDSAVFPHLNEMRECMIATANENDLLRAKLESRQAMERDLRERIRLLTEENRKLSNKPMAIHDLFSG